MGFIPDGPLLRTDFMGEYIMILTPDQAVIFVGVTFTAGGFALGLMLGYYLGLIERIYKVK